MLTHLHWNQQSAVIHIVCTIWMCSNMNWIVQWPCMDPFPCCTVMGKIWVMKLVDSRWLFIYHPYKALHALPQYIGKMQLKPGSTFTIRMRKRMSCHRLWIWCLDRDHPIRWQLILCRRVASSMHSFWWDRNRMTCSSNIPIWLALHHYHRYDFVEIWFYLRWD